MPFDLPKAYDKEDQSMIYHKLRDLIINAKISNGCRTSLGSLLYIIAPLDRDMATQRATVTSYSEDTTSLQEGKYSDDATS